ncbi:MAG: hypothetical protein ACK44O_13135 [Novosphingobium sp.]|jgi:hypothetical protein|uniref:hypothetical protein n=1 Tax=Novosphingobium sp. TaxID=1874826 RepID=UPI003918A92E|nr:hypothetical protein [Novosphingobium sp.]
MLTFLMVWGIASLVALFADHSVEARLSANGQKTAGKLWSVLFYVLWTGSVFFILSLGTIAFLKRYFPDQSIYLLSGSPITAYPIVFWGVVCGWCLTGIPAALLDRNVERYSPEKQLDQLFAFPGWVFRKALWILAWAIGVALIVLVGMWAGESVEKMAPSTAIIFGAVIIAWAITAQRK